MKALFGFFSAAALLVFPSGVVVVDNASGLVALIVVLSGLITAATLKKRIFVLTREEKFFFFVMPLLLISAVITSIYNDTGLAKADRFSIFILAIPVYIFFKFNTIKEKYIWSGLVAGSFIVLTVALYQMFGPVQQRPHGSVNAILFGDLALLMGVMSLAGVGWFHQQGRWMVAIPFCAFIAGSAASALSMSRGGWLALPFLGLILAVYSTRYLSCKKIATILALTVLFIGIVYLVPQTGVQGRLTLSVDEVEQYLVSTDVNDPARSNSIGTRLELWKAAWLIFTDNPVAGVGWGNLQPASKVLVEEGLVNQRVLEFYHSHNQYLSALAKGGLLGFLSLSILLCFPMLVFLKYSQVKYNDEVNRMAVAGLILVAGFACFGFTEAILERSRGISFYSFYLGIFMALILQHRQNSNL